MAFYHLIWHFKWHSTSNRADLHTDTVAHFRTSGENLVRTDRRIASGRIELQRPVSRSAKRSTKTKWRSLSLQVRSLGR